MSERIKFLGSFIYQADILRPRHRSPERFDVEATAEYEIPTLNKLDITADAVVVCVPNKKDRLDRFAFDGWEGALWSPLDTVPDEGKPARSPITLMDYRVGFRVNWVRDSRLHYHTDPLRRAYARRLAPTDRGSIPNYPSDKKTITESEIAGTITWSNRGDALRRHLDHARDLIVVDELMYVRRPDPVWAVSRDSNGRRARLTVPQFFISSDSDVMPKSHDGRFLSNMNVFRADRATAALADGIPASGEILALDERFLSRDDVAWSLYCRLGSILNNTELLFRALPAEAVSAMKAISDAFDASTMWNLTAISTRKLEIITHLTTLSLSISAASCPTKLISARDYALRGISNALEQCGTAPNVESILHPDDEAGVASLASGAARA
jgi:hypothetical protein